MSKINLILATSLIFHSCFLAPSNATADAEDTISATRVLTGDQTIVSAGGNFRLGFFQPGKSSNFYIGLWYNKVSLQTVVWVANRDKPVKDKFRSRLRFSGGNLVLFDESGNSVWDTNLLPINSKDVKAVLLDNGNFVVRNEREILWESFDFPTHTWLPGSKVGLNKITNKSQTLRSWKNWEDPSPGLFSLEFDSKGNEYLIRWKNSEIFWTSGPWNGEIFSLVPEMRLTYLYNFSYVSNENESYFTYSLYNDLIVSRFVMDVSGQVKQMTWLDATKEWNLFWSQPRTQCEVYAFCGAFSTCNQASNTFCGCLAGFEPVSLSDWNLNDHSGGCVRKAPTKCRTGQSYKDRDEFLVRPNVRLPVRGEFKNAGTREDCEMACLKNCSCTGYAYGGNCTVWMGDLLGVQQFSESDHSGETLYIRLAASEFPSHNSKEVRLLVCFIAGSAVVLVVAVIALGLKVLMRKGITATKGVGGSVVAFGYRDLQSATKNFSDKLGGGGFGSVFRGTLPDSTAVAVKKLEGFGQGEKQFRSEVSTIGTIQHLNLVRLYGFCSEGSKRLIVYEYMSNGSLDAHLFHGRGDLDWKARYRIAIDTARGLHYLHEKCRDCIIHCDIKPENILLDAELCPKVADFGLAKLMGREFSRVLTTMRGTRGYLAPEWISGVAITAKADVYSYGMMLFELISGRRNSQESDDGKIRFFPTQVVQTIVQEGDGGAADLLGLLDSRLRRNADEGELRRVCRVACWCVQDDENHRPSMGQVVQILSGVLDVGLPAVPRSLQIFAETVDQNVYFSEYSSTKGSGLRTQ